MFEKLRRNLRFGEFRRTLFHLACGSDAIDLQTKGQPKTVGVFAKIVLENITPKDCITRDDFDLIPVCYLLMSTGKDVKFDDTEMSHIETLFSKTCEGLSTQERFTFGESHMTLLHIACGSGFEYRGHDGKEVKCEIPVHPVLSAKLILALENLSTSTETNKFGKTPLMYALENIESFSDGTLTDAALNTLSLENIEVKQSTGAKKMVNVTFGSGCGIYNRFAEQGACTAIP